MRARSDRSPQNCSYSRARAGKSWAERGRIIERLGSDSRLCELPPQGVIGRLARVVSIEQQRRSPAGEVLLDPGVVITEAPGREGRARVDGEAGVKKTA